MSVKIYKPATRKNSVSWVQKLDPQSHQAGWVTAETLYSSSKTCQTVHHKMTNTTANCNSWDLLYYHSRNLVNSCTTVGTSCTNPEQIKAMELEHYGWLTCNEQPRPINHCTHQVDCQRVLLTTQSACYMAKFCKYPYFWRYLNFLQHSVGQVEGSCHAKDQLDSFGRFDRTQTCDRHRHRVIASTVLASLGNKCNIYKLQYGLVQNTFPAGLPENPKHTTTIMKWHVHICVNLCITHYKTQPHNRQRECAFGVTIHTILGIRIISDKIYILCSMSDLSYLAKS